jgi:hypothetical protein
MKRLTIDGRLQIGLGLPHVLLWRSIASFIRKQLAAAAKAHTPKMAGAARRAGHVPRS